jgi:hypothetical protein
MAIEGVATRSSAVRLDNTTNGANSVPYQGRINGDGEASVISVGQATRVNSSFDSKESMSATIRMIAWNINFADNAMGNISDLIPKMKSKLTTIVKVYPPYPPGSQEREQLLKSYAGLRREIEQLTIPPSYQFAQKILSDPTQDSGAGDQNITIGENGPSVTIHSQPINLGPTGLNIPDLSVTATDEQVSAALTSLDSAQGTLNQKREGLASDSYAVARTVEFAVKNTQINFSFSGQSVSTDITELSIGIKSAQVRQTLSSDPAVSLTFDKNAYLKGYYIYGP